MRFRTRLLSFTIVILGMTCNAYGQASFDDGLTARYAGDLETAAQIFSDLTQENPENSDAWVQLGLTHLTLENYDEAEAALKRAIEIAPDYSDAYLGLARLEWFRGNREPAEEYLSLAGDTEDTRALRRQINATPDVKKWRADIGLGYSDLSNSLPSWEQVDVALGYQFSEDTSATIGLQYANRFNISDVYVDAGLTHTLKNRTLLFASVGTAPDGDGGGSLGFHRSRRLKKTMRAPSRMTISIIASSRGQGEGRRVRGGSAVRTRGSGGASGDAAGLPGAAAVPWLARGASCGSVVGLAASDGVVGLG